MSKSVEHIIPESLWNTKQILPRGVVCDKCNNYFSRKVEKPFLCSTEIEVLRFNESIPSKKGRVPSIQAVLDGSSHPIRVHQLRNGDDFSLHIDLNSEQFDLIEKLGTCQLYMLAGFDDPPADKTSRFLAKVALEAMAQRFLQDKTGVDCLIDDPQLDPLRNHARYGTPKEWPFLSRRIYRSRGDEYIHGERGQLVHEYDFLLTQQRELYFVLALYGVEMTINVGGPVMHGYELWLGENSGKSPLYTGKNSGR
jgi:hypothetical protein